MMDINEGNMEKVPTGLSANRNLETSSHIDQYIEVENRKQIRHKSK